MKAERDNPGASIKDRIALAMIEDAEQKGELKKDMIIIEPTSGNTGIGLALVAAVKGYRLILTMPESMSIERRKYLQALGAELILTPKELGMGGTITRANELLDEYPNSWMPQQFCNPANVQAHRDTTAQEILADFPEGIDFLITGVGTGGHITGCAEVLKEKFASMQAFAVEPLRALIQIVVFALIDKDHDGRGRNTNVLEIRCVRQHGDVTCDRKAYLEVDCLLSYP